MSQFIKGVDVSHYQAGLDLKGVKDAGNQFVFAKASDGLDIDPTFMTFRQQAGKLGLLFGGYHFFRFDIDPILQAQNAFKATAGVASGELPFFLDVEWDKQSKNYGEGCVMDQAATTAVAVCLAQLQLLMGMNSVGIYTNYYFWSQGNPVTGGVFGYVPLWVPAYNTTFDKVKIPPPWRQATFWQYSESISMQGTDGIDGNYFLGTRSQLQALVKV